MLFLEPTVLLSEKCVFQILRRFVNTTKPIAGLLRVLWVVIGFFSSSELTASQSHQFLNQSFI